MVHKKKESCKHTSYFVPSLRTRNTKPDSMTCNFPKRQYVYIQYNKYR